MAGERERVSLFPEVQSRTDSAVEWTDEGIVLGVRRHGEGNAIVELLTRLRGRHLGMVRGGASRRQAPLLQPGNTVSATWRARLDEHMGNYALEPAVVRTEVLMRAPHAAFGFTHMAQMLHLLPERDPHEGLFLTLGAILDAFEDRESAGRLLARFELALLAELGFGLELETCAATGSRENLVYVSPKSGRAVCGEAGAPYAGRLFALPRFLVEGTAPPAGDVEDALRLTGHFLLTRVLEPRGLGLSDARAAFVSAWRRSTAPV
jgi:DNA repair protein RecO (recombination protein O)